MDPPEKSKTLELQNGLKEIVQTNKEILELFDAIEERQKSGHPSTKGKAISGGAFSNESKNIHKDGAASSIPDENLVADDKHSPGQRNPKEEHDKELTLPGPRVKNLKPVIVQDGKPKLGNLKIIKKKTLIVEHKPGFSERIILREGHRKYGTCLKAKKTVLEQDNRICDEFDLPLINRGHVYTSVTGNDEPDPDNDRAKSDKTERDKPSAESFGKMDVKKMESKPVLLDRKKTQEPERQTGSSKEKKQLKSILKKPQTSNDPRLKQQRGKEVKRDAQTQSTSVVISSSTHAIDIKEADRSSNSEENISQMLQVFDVKSDQGKQFLKMQAKAMRSEFSIILPEKKEAFHACADIMDKMSASNNNIEDPEFWQKMSKEMGQDQRTALAEYMDELKALFTDEIQLDENLRILMLGSVAILQSIIEGTFLERCVALGQYAAQHPEQFSNPKTAQFAVMRAWSQMETERESKMKKGIMIQQSPSSGNSQSAIAAIESHQPRVIYQKVKKVEEERVTIDESRWSEYANEEVKKGQFAKDIRWNGMDTIFCLDVSMSMAGEPMRQAKTFVKGFIEGIQNTKLGGDVYEHVSLITFGSETKVQQHLTCDYFEVLRKLERITPAGPSPLFAGLTMTWAAILGAGTVFSSNGYKIHPRVYLLSDGKMTPSSIIAGPDTCTTEEKNTERGKVISRSIHLHKEYHITINAVPVGEFDMGLLESVTKETGGKIISPEDWKTESRTFKNYLQAISTGQSSQLRKLMIELQHTDEDDQVQMDEFLRTHKREGGYSNQTDNEDLQAGQELECFPPLGSRIRRKQVRSTQLYGTVTKHFKDGVGVTWDHEDENGSLRVKMEGIDDIERVNKPRILKDQLIAEGCRVKRGADWSYGDQDGKPGNEGAVFMVLQNGTIIVRWDHDGSKAIYKYGHEGRFDVEIVDPYGKAPERRNISHSKNDKHIKEMKMENKQILDKNRKIHGAVTDREFKWSWRERDGSWKSYPDAINATIETGYKRSPTGSVLITFDKRQFRIVFDKMEQTDINSKEKFPVSRK